MGTTSSKKTHTRVTSTQAQAVFLCFFSSSENYSFEEIKTIPAWQSLRVGRQGWTILHIAVWTGNSLLVKQLLDEGVNPELTDYNGDTALDLAKELRDFSLIELFVPTDREADKHTNSTLDAEGRSRFESSINPMKAGDAQKVRPL